MSLFIRVIHNKKLLIIIISSIILVLAGLTYLYLTGRLGIIGFPIRQGTERPSFPDYMLRIADLNFNEPLSSGGDVYYVKIDGSDENTDGKTLESAFKTIQKAASIVDGPGDIVLIQGGTYDEEVTLSKSGASDNYITFEGQGAVIIEGGDRQSCISVNGSHNYLKNFECQHGATGIKIASNAVGTVIEGSRIHDNRPPAENSDAFYYSGCITGPAMTIIKKSEVYSCSRSGIYLQGTGIIVGNNNPVGIHNNGVGVFMRIYQDRPIPIITDNKFINNPQAFATSDNDANKILVLERNEFDNSGIKFANGRLEIKDNTFRNTKAISFSESSTDVFIDHNLFVNCNPAFELSNNPVLFSDDNVFSVNTIISYWQSPEETAGSWMESTSKTLGGWQNNSGQDSNSVIGNSLDETTRSTIFVTNWTILPVLNTDGSNINFSGAAVSEQDASVKLEFSIIDSENNKRSATIENFGLTANTEINFNKNVQISGLTGRVRCQLDIFDSNNTRIGGKFKYIAATSAMKLEWLNPTYRASIFADQADKELRIKTTITTENLDLADWKFEAGVRIKGQTNLLDNPQPINPDAAPELTISLPGNNLAPGTVELPASYELVVTLKNGNNEAVDQKIMSFLVLAAKTNRETQGSDVRIDANGNMLVDGQPFFPVMIDGGSGNIPELTTFAEAGFNVAVLYCSAGNDTFWNTAKNLGIKILAIEIKANQLIDSTKTPEEKTGFLNDVETRINAIKNRPALLGYLWGEELNWKAELIDLYQRSASLDPYHPVAMNGSFSGTNSLYYLADIMMNHLYPYPKYGDTQAQVAGKIKDIANLSSTQVNIANGNDLENFPGPHLATGKKGWWLWTQYFYGDNWPTGGNGRFLTLTEMRGNVWSAIARGGKGINFWTSLNPYTNIRFNPKLWESIRAIAGEIRSLNDVLVQPSIDNKVTADYTTDLNMMVKEYQGNLYIITAYNGSDPRDIKFSFADNKSGNISVWSENRTIPIQSNAFTDTFEPMGVHIYTTASPATGLKMQDLLADTAFTAALDYQTKIGNLAAIQNGASATSNHNYEDIHHANHSNYAIDSDPDTNWYPLYDGEKSPAFSNPTGSPEWLEVTLPKQGGNDPIINQIVVHSYKPKHYSDPDAVMRDFDLMYWNGSNWLTIQNISGNTEETKTVNFIPVSTNKIRLTAKYGLYVSEIEAYAGAAPENIIENDTTSFNFKTYQSLFALFGPKGSNYQVFLGETLIADFGATSWNTTIPLSRGTHNYDIIYKNNSGIEVSRKTVVISSNRFADINGDNAVDILDLSIFANYWETVNPAERLTDLNEDGVVDLMDLSLFANHWGG